MLECGCGYLGPRALQTDVFTCTWRRTAGELATEMGKYPDMRANKIRALTMVGRLEAGCSGGERLKTCHSPLGSCELAGGNKMNGDRGPQTRRQANASGLACMCINTHPQNGRGHRGVLYLPGYLMTHWVVRWWEAGPGPPDRAVNGNPFPQPLREDFSNTRALTPGSASRHLPVGIFSRMKNKACAPSYTLWH